MRGGGETQKKKKMVDFFWVGWGVTKTKPEPKNNVYHQRKTTEPETFSVSGEKETQGEGGERSRKLGKSGPWLAVGAGSAFFLPPPTNPPSPALAQQNPPHKPRHIRNGWLHYSCHYRLPSHNSQRTPTSTVALPGGGGAKGAGMSREGMRERAEVMWGDGGKRESSEIQSSGKGGMREE